jgi:hypothetical protein
MKPFTACFDVDFVLLTSGVRSVALMILLHL